MTTDFFALAQTICYPLRSEEKVMTDIGDAFREHREHVRKQRQANRCLAFDEYEDAFDFAIEHDMDLTAKAGDVHYQLTVYLSHKPLQFWLYNLYPGNQQIYADPHHKGPFLRNLPEPWKFEDIIYAANRARDDL